MMSYLSSRWSKAEQVERFCWLYVGTIPFYLVPLAVSRIQVSEVIFIATMLCLFWQVFWHRRRLEVPRNAFTLCVGLYVAVSVISLVNSPVLTRGLVEVTIITYFASLYFLFVNIIQNQDQLWALVDAWLVAAALVVFIGLVGIVLAFMGIPTQTVDSDFVNAYMTLRLPRAFSTMITAKLLATYLVVSLALAIARFQVEVIFRARILILVLIAGMVVSLFFTFSREWVSAMVALLVLWFCSKPKIYCNFFRAATLSTVVVIFLVIQLISTVVILDVTSQTNRYSGMPIGPNIIDAYNPEEGIHRSQVSADYIMTDYLTLKKVAWSMMSEHPWIGTGVGTFSVYLKRRVAEGSVHRKLAGYGVPHSTIFGKAGEIGLVGLVILGALFTTWIVSLVRTFRMAVNSSDRWLVAALLAGVIGLLSNSLNIDLMNLRVLWCVLGMGMAIHTAISRSILGGGKRKFDIPVR